MQEPELWRDWEYCYIQSIGCVGILKDWFTRALAEALEHNAPTLTRTDLERHAWSFDQCEKMAKDALDGEIILSQKPDAFMHLKNLLGLQNADAQTTNANSLPQVPITEDRKLNQRDRRVRVGSRKAVRDVVGVR